MVKEVHEKGNAYKLELPDRWKLHPVISAEHLEPAPAPNSDLFECPAPNHAQAIDDGDHSDQWAVKRLINRRVRRVGRYRKEVVTVLTQHVQ